jgi:hypothetical protein
MEPAFVMWFKLNKIICHDLTTVTFRLSSSKFRVLSAYSICGISMFWDRLFCEVVYMHKLHHIC